MDSGELLLRLKSIKVLAESTYLLQMTHKTQITKEDLADQLKTISLDCDRLIADIVEVRND